MNLRKLAFLPIAAALAFGAAAPAVASTETFTFGDILNPVGGYDPVPSWATLSVTTLDSPTDKQYQFTLTLGSNFSALFGAGSFVSEAIFNTTSGVDPISTALAGTGNGVSGIKFLATPPAISVGFDFGDCFGVLNGANGCGHGGPSGQLVSGEHVSWTAKFNAGQGDPLNFSSPAAALHVQAITGQNISSAWYGPMSPVPEPETYAMLLAGLGLMGFVARRKTRAS